MYYHQNRYVLALNVLGESSSRRAGLQRHAQLSPRWNRHSKFPLSTKKHTIVLVHAVWFVHGHIELGARTADTKAFRSLSALDSHPTRYASEHTSSTSYQGSQKRASGLLSHDPVSHRGQIICVNPPGIIIALIAPHPEVLQILPL